MATTQHSPELSPHADKITSALGSFFHPTRAAFLPHEQPRTPTDQSSSSPITQGNAGTEYDKRDASHWSSRASRKGRYRSSQVVIHHHPHPAHQLPTPHSRQTDSTKDGRNGEARDTQPSLSKPASVVMVQQRVKHAHSQLKPHLRWDISFWVAIAFVLGSAAWICNGHILYTPLSPTPSPPHPDAAAWLAFAGGTLFEIGAYLAYVEALNAGHEQMFVQLRRASEKHKNIAKSEMKGNGRQLDSDSASEDSQIGDGKEPKFRWFGHCSPRDIGYLAAAVQLFAATIFWVSTVSGLPTLLPTLATAWPPSALTIIFFWTPQVIGGMGFIVASVLLMEEEQRSWWRIAPTRIGWHVAFWNVVGAVGFMLCGALGYGSTASTKVNYQSVLCTFWGSWAFMIGSVAQLWEAVWREPTDANAEQGDSEKNGR